jgi:phage FluMu protein Com
MDNDQTISIKRPVSNTDAAAAKLVQKQEKPKYPSEVIGLPSEGHFYSESTPLHQGTVDIKYMTAKEEDILTSQNLIKKGIVLEKLLESLIVTPDVKVEDLLIGDKNALFVAARRLAYGDSYGPLEIKCPKCGKENKCTVDLSKIGNKEFDFSKYEKHKNRFEFKLPVSNKVVTFKLLTHRDEQAIEQEITSINKTFKNGTSPEVTTRLKRLIIAVDGNEDRQTIIKFVDTELLSRDSLALRNYAKDITPDVDMAFDFSCSDCAHEERVGVPMEVSFFWPNA